MLWGVRQMTCMRSVCQAGMRGSWEIPISYIWRKHSPAKNRHQKGVSSLFCFYGLKKKCSDSWFSNIDNYFSGNIVCGLWAAFVFQANRCKLITAPKNFILGANPLATITYNKTYNCSNGFAVLADLSTVWERSSEEEKVAWWLKNQSKQSCRILDDNIKR